MCATQQAVVAGLVELVGDAPEVPVNSLRIFLRCVNRLASPDTLFVLPGDSVFGISSMQCQLVVIENVLLAGSFMRVNLWRPLGTVTEEKFPDKEAAAEGAKLKGSHRGWAEAWLPSHHLLFHLTHFVE